MNENLFHIYDDLLSDVLVEIIFEMHKWNRERNSYCQICRTRCKSFVSKVAVDIYGQPRDSNSEKYDCPNCKIGYPAARFAPHLEKCLGLGRRPGRRLTASTSIDRVSPCGFSEDDEEEFAIQPVEKKKKPKAAKKKIKTEKDSSQGGDLLFGDLVFDNQSLWGPMVDTANNDFTSTFLDFDETKDILFDNVSL